MKTFYYVIVLLGFAVALLISFFGGLFAVFMYLFAGIGTIVWAIGKDIYENFIKKSPANTYVDVKPPEETDTIECSCTGMERGIEKHTCRHLRNPRTKDV